MKTAVVAVALMGAVSSAQASTIDAIDLLLRVDSIGFTDAEITDNDGNVVEKFAFLDVADDSWGIPTPFNWFSTGQIVSLKAKFDGSDKLVSCSLGGISCLGASGSFEAQSFSIGDAVGKTFSENFVLQGGEWRRRCCVFGRI